MPLNDLVIHVRNLWHFYSEINQLYDRRNCTPHGADFFKIPGQNYS